jgi:hypothetical protein
LQKQRRQPMINNMMTTEELWISFWEIAINVPRITQKCPYFILWPKVTDYISLPMESTKSNPPSPSPNSHK